jgi:hypothetical protein
MIEEEKMNPVDFEKILDALDWQEVKFEETEKTDEVPRATHKGILKVGDKELTVYQLETGQRLFDQKDLEEFFGMTMNELLGK